MRPIGHAILVLLSFVIGTFSLSMFFVVDIEAKLRRIEEDPEGSGTSHLFNCIEGVSSIANRAFGPLFERQVGGVQFFSSLWTF